MQRPARGKILDVWVCKMRKKLKPFGINIKTHWGGYEMPEASKAIARELMAQPTWITKALGNRWPPQKLARREVRV
jgi:hypothetical protein